MTDIKALFEQLYLEADAHVLALNPEKDYYDRTNLSAEPEWCEYLTRLVAEHIADVVTMLGEHWDSDTEEACFRQAWFGDDFNYGEWARPMMTQPMRFVSGWNSAFLYNGSDGIISMPRAVAYEMVRRGALPPNAVGKNSRDFEEGGSLH